MYVHIKSSTDDNALHCSSSKFHGHLEITAATKIAAQRHNWSDIIRQDCKEYLPFCKNIKYPVSTAYLW